LVANGYLNAAGNILEKFDPKNPHFDLKVPAEFLGLKAEIVDEINRKLFKNRIVNARDRRELKFRKEVQLSAEFQALWDKIKHPGSAECDLALRLTTPIIFLLAIFVFVKHTAIHCR
jgi:type III restriction enzyme